MSKNFTTVAFTESVKAVQEAQGSRKSYERMEHTGDNNAISPREMQFIQTRDSFFMATVGENGWPYVQFRGGPPGFLKVLDETTLGMADFRGNRQYISVGNLTVSEKVCLFLIDYPTQKRLKIWARTEIADLASNPELLETLREPDYPATVERLLIFRLEAYDWNCPQHIVPRYTIEQIKNGMAGF